MRMLIYRSVIISIFAVIFCAGAVCAEEEIEYKKFKFDDAACDVGVRIKNTPKGMLVGVSALATGKGSEFRKWSVAGIKLNLDGQRRRADKEANFYVTEESFWRIPGAIAFAAIGAFGEYGGSNLNNNMNKIGVGLGMGILALQANGEITGERSLFIIPPETAAAIKEGSDAIEIRIQNENLHVNHDIKIGLMRPTGEVAVQYNYDKMSQKDLLNKVSSLKDQIATLEEEQSSYKYGEDPQYDELQKRIEKLETERGMAYKAWFERARNTGP